MQNFGTILNPFWNFNNGGKRVRRLIEIPLAPMGVLAPGSAHARPAAQPPSTLAEIVWRMCLTSHAVQPPTN